MTGRCVVLSVKIRYLNIFLYESSCLGHPRLLYCPVRLVHKPKACSFCGTWICFEIHPPSYRNTVLPRILPSGLHSLQPKAFLQNKTVAETLICFGRRLPEKFSKGFEHMTRGKHFQPVSYLFDQNELSPSNCIYQ